ncbi:MAG: hypothetical protein K2Q01_10940, partial [Rickettsiales bacterium]|nr:hypothetical protein [Rickettsiales bacterium]
MTATAAKPAATGAIESKLAQMGITLPPSVMPQANYVPYTISGNMVFVSGTLPMKDGKPQDI